MRNMGQRIADEYRYINSLRPQKYPYDAAELTPQEFWEKCKEGSHL